MLLDHAGLPPFGTNEANVADSSCGCLKGADAVGLAIGCGLAGILLGAGIAFLLSKKNTPPTLNTKLGGKRMMTKSSSPA